MRSSASLIVRYEGLFRHEAIPAEVRDAGLLLMAENIEGSIGYIQAAVGRLARIIDALLRLSRAGRVEYHWQILDLHTMIRKVVDALQDTIANKKAEVILRELPAACGDATAVEQIFANLISNAVHYLDEARSGTIEVGSDPSTAEGVPAGFHVYYVKDNGLGIPEAYHQRVFTAFNRLHANVAQGEGIGLALVRRMVERHGGKIWLQSAAGVGSTFFVALPAATPDGNVPTDLDRRPAMQSLERRQPSMAIEPILIVLVEDDDGHAELVERNLKRAGVANGIRRLKDGQEAIDFVQAQGASGGRGASHPDAPLARHQDAARRRRGSAPSAQVQSADGIGAHHHADHHRRSARN